MKDKTKPLHKGLFFWIPQHTYDCCVTERIPMDLKQIIEGAVRDSLQKSGKLPKEKKKEEMKPGNKLVESAKAIKNVIKEALVAIPQTFNLNTERLSDATKRVHEQLYNSYVDAFNKSSSAIDGSNKHEANVNFSEYRSLKLDENYNLNAIKLHELYFYNISDQASEISVDALPYMRLSRDFGTFENWQFDFMAACRSAKSGWAVLVYEPYKNTYMNVVVDSHNVGLPLAAVPVLVMDMWEHAYVCDYENDKNDYIVAMMREINWNVVEARMALAEKSELDALYMIKPVYNSVPQEMLDNAMSPPIDQVNAPGEVEVPATTPPGPEVASPQRPEEERY